MVSGYMRNRKPYMQVTIFCSSRLILFGEKHAILQGITRIRTPPFENNLWSQTREEGPP